MEKSEVQTSLGINNRRIKPVLFLLEMTRVFDRAPGGARFLRVKVPNPPGSGKDIAEGKGVHREVESEGSWM